MNNFYRHNFIKQPMSAADHDSDSLCPVMLGCCALLDCVYRHLCRTYEPFKLLARHSLVK